uniref:Protoporphyrinogen oxidase n=1 Tax=Strigomonas galati TaxID=1003336 RepID=G1C9Q0_9TRYP|nr:protoporphyrinogen oxidase [Strigomonas galati]
MKYMLLFSTTDGHTKVIANAIAEAIRTKDSAAQCAIQDLKAFMTHNKQTEAGVTDLKHYDKVILGASIRYGYFSEDVHQFVKQYYPHLNSFPTAFYAVNMTARKPNKRTPETNPYARKFLIESPWIPTKAAVFAGALYYPRYSFFDRNMIRFIMKITGGDTDPTLEKVYTDWDSVKAFAGEVVAMTAADIPAAQARIAELEKAEALKERTMHFYQMCAFGTVASVAAFTMFMRSRR